jgi:hypothetical protein
VAQMLRQRGWTDTELGKRKKGDRGKVAMAARLRRETTMSWGWATGGEPPTRCDARHEMTKHTISHL